MATKKATTKKATENKTTKKTVAEEKKTTSKKKSVNKKVSKTKEDKKESSSKATHKCKCKAGEKMIRLSEITNKVIKVTNLKDNHDNPEKISNKIYMSYMEQAATLSKEALEDNNVVTVELGPIAIRMRKVSCDKYRVSIGCASDFIQKFAPGSVDCHFNPGDGSIND